METCCRPWTWWCNDSTALAAWLRELDDDDDDDDDVNSSIENYVFVIPVGELQCCGHAFTHTR